MDMGGGGSQDVASTPRQFRGVSGTTQCQATGNRFQKRAVRRGSSKIRSSHHVDCTFSVARGKVGQAAGSHDGGMERQMARYRTAPGASNGSVRQRGIRRRRGRTSAGDTLAAWRSGAGGASALNGTAERVLGQDADREWYGMRWQATDPQQWAGQWAKIREQK